MYNYKVRSDCMVKSTCVSQILEQSANLSEKIKEKENVNPEKIVDWISETNDMIFKLGKAIDKLEERLEILEEIMKE